MSKILGKIACQAPFGLEHDTIFMQQSPCMQAHKAFAQAMRCPVGALVVNRKGTIVARAYNQVETRMTQMAHAELVALLKAGKKLGDWRLDGCWLYVTLEPCGMCMALIFLESLGGLCMGHVPYLGIER